MNYRYIYYTFSAGLVPTLRHTLALPLGSTSNTTIPLQGILSLTAIEIMELQQQLLAIELRCTATDAGLQNNGTECPASGEGVGF